MMKKITATAIMPMMSPQFVFLAFDVADGGVEVVEVVVDGAVLEGAKLAVIVWFAAILVNV